MRDYYPMKIAGLERKLPLFRISDDLYIAGLIIFGDAELTVAAAGELLKKAPDWDVMISAEAKSIPLIHEMSRQSGYKPYVVARKYPKAYMKDIISVDVHSITTDKKQTLCIDGSNAQTLKGRRVLVVDDVVSTGESLAAVEKLVKMAGGKVCGRACIVAEGDALERDDLIYLEPLPLFNADGSVKE